VDNLLGTNVPVVPTLGNRQMWGPVAAVGDDVDLAARGNDRPRDGRSEMPHGNPPFYG